MDNFQNRALQVQLADRKAEVFALCKKLDKKALDFNRITIPDIRLSQAPSRPATSFPQQASSDPADQLAVLKEALHRIELAVNSPI